jgi:hypothetical protein
MLREIAKTSVQNWRTSMGGVTAIAFVIYDVYSQLVSKGLVEKKALLITIVAVGISLLLAKDGKVEQKLDIPTDPTGITHQ